MKIEGIQAISVPDGWIPPPPCFLGLMETLSKIQSQKCVISRYCKFIFCFYPKHSGRMDSKSIHSTIDAPPGVPGVSNNQNFFLQIKLLNSCARIDPKRQNFENVSKLKKKTCQKTLFSYTYLNILQFGVNLSAPDLKWHVQWMQEHLLTPLAPLAARQQWRYQLFNICF